MKFLNKKRKSILDKKKKEWQRTIWLICDPWNTDSCLRGDVLLPQHHSFLFLVVSLMTQMKM